MQDGKKKLICVDLDEGSKLCFMAGHGSVVFWALELKDGTTIQLPGAEVMPLITAKLAETLYRISRSM